MKKQVFIGLGILIIISIALAIANREKAVSRDKKITLGYCPSMEAAAVQIENQNKNIRIARKESTSDVLNSLDTGSIDIALVGRIAKKSETGNCNKRVIGSGYTLISNTKKFVQKKDLNSIKIHTALDKAVAESLLPGTEIAYYASLSEAIMNGVAEAVIIDWEDYEDRMELVVVMDGELKAKEFRIPVLYSSSHRLENIKVEL